MGGTSDFHSWKGHFKVRGDLLRKASLKVLWRIGAEPRTEAGLPLPALALLTCSHGQLFSPPLALGGVFLDTGAGTQDLLSSLTTS